LQNEEFCYPNSESRLFRRLEIQKIPHFACALHGTFFAIPLFWIKKAAGKKACGNTSAVFSYGGIIRIRSQVEIIAVLCGGFPLSPSFIELPTCKVYYNTIFLICQQIFKLQ